jgi:hypothetical protein
MSISYRVCKCGISPIHDPSVVIDSDGFCQVCAVEWRGIEAQGLTGRQVINRWNKRIPERTKETRARIDAAYAARQDRAA